MLTKERYSNVSKKIYERTGIYLEQRQLKNKYDLLKKDWQAWSFLENPKYGVTGIGYDYATGTWNASDEWWGMMIQVFLITLHLFSFPMLETEMPLQPLPSYELFLHFGY